MLMTQDKKGEINMAPRKATTSAVKTVEADVKVEKAATPETETKETDASVVEAAEAEVKKETVSKASGKKGPAKKATVKKADQKVGLHVQFSGKSYSQEELVKIAQDVWKYDLKQKVRSLASIELYVKPEENLVYYVMNQEFTGSFSI